MKGFFVGAWTVVVALVTGLGLGMYAMYTPPAASKQPANAFAKRESPKVVQPETTGTASPDPRLAIPNAPAEPNATEISAAQKKQTEAERKKAERAEASERKKAERKARREARKKEARRKARDAYASDDYQPHEYGWGFTHR